MNVELLRKIAQVIQERPAEFNMNAYHSTGGCHTTHCIGGWSDVLSGKNLNRINTDPVQSDRRCAITLGLTRAQARRLFYGNQWPDQFRAAPPECPHLPRSGWWASAALAAARIEHFIATDGRE